MGRLTPGLRSVITFTSGVPFSMGLLEPHDFWSPSVAPQGVERMLPATVRSLERWCPFQQCPFILLNIKEEGEIYAGINYDHCVDTEKQFDLKKSKLHSLSWICFSAPLLGRGWKANICALPFYV